jgi:hypothetical protein
MALVSIGPPEVESVKGDGVFIDAGPVQRGKPVISHSNSSVALENRVAAFLSGRVRMRKLAIVVWILCLVVLATYIIRISIRADFLLWAALPVGLIPIFGLRLLRPKEEQAGWVVFTIWLASTYVGIGSTSEMVATTVVVILGVLGYWKSPWFFVAAWWGHIIWDFVPRNLPELLSDLPMACVLFDGLIGAYLARVAVLRAWERPAGNVGQAPPG